MKFLIFGDVVGRPGRAAISRVLADLKNQYQPDAVIINIENIAHGAGISPASFAEVAPWGGQVYTTGDHAWDNKAGVPLLENKSLPIIRPANYPAGAPGRGYIIFGNGAWQVAIINLQGQVFMRNHPANPFEALDQLLQIPDIKNAHIRLVDFHAQASSEKRAMGWYSDGRVAAIWGTHTHVPTADAQILPRGTGYITDVGMNGAYHSIIGVDPAGPLKTFRQQTPAKFDPPEGGPLEVNALYLDVDPKQGTTTDIAQIRKILDD